MLYMELESAGWHVQNKTAKYMFRLLNSTYSAEIHRMGFNHCVIALFDQICEIVVNPFSCVKAINGEI